MKLGYKKVIRGEFKNLVWAMSRAGIFPCCQFLVLRLIYFKLFWIAPRYYKTKYEKEEYELHVEIEDMLRKFYSLNDPQFESYCHKYDYDSGGISYKSIIWLTIYGAEIKMVLTKRTRSFFVSFCQYPWEVPSTLVKIYGKNLVSKTN